MAKTGSQFHPVLTCAWCGKEFKVKAMAQQLGKGTFRLDDEHFVSFIEGNDDVGEIIDAQLESECPQARQQGDTQ